MRILHIAMGTPEFDRAALDLGHEVQRIAWREVLGKKFTSGHSPVLQSMVVAKCSDFKPDLVFVQTHQSDVIAPSTYAAMRKAAFVVNWCGDVREPLPSCYLQYAKHVDVMAFSNLTDVELVRAAGYRSEYLQIGYDPLIYHPGDGTQERSGIVFMANHYEGRFPNTQLRKDVALRLMKEFPNDFSLYGSGWDIPGIVPAHPEDEANIYRSALVAINVDHFTRPYFASDRILRAQACGCAVVSIDYPGLEEEHSLVMPREDVDGIVDFIRSLYEAGVDADFHEEVATHVYANHRWTNRIKTMESWMS